MTRVRFSLLFLVSLGCIGCSSISTNSACKATATDSCLTIEQVDDMTHFADEMITYNGKKTHHTKPNYSNHVGHGRVVQKHNGSSLWVSEAVREKSWA
ncbi:MAG: conjugal transfer protein [Legionella sp.]|uniref:conjugal transfer protein n=1 Tax=Legionella sp. TaxID=459 RepID=UPI0039E26423